MNCPIFPTRHQAKKQRASAAMGAGASASRHDHIWGDWRNKKLRPAQQIQVGAGGCGSWGAGSPRGKRVLLLLSLLSVSRCWERPTRAVERVGFGDWRRQATAMAQHTHLTPCYSLTVPPPHTRPFTTNNAPWFRVRSVALLWARE